MRNPLKSGKTNGRRALALVAVLCLAATVFLGASTVLLGASTAAAAAPVNRLIEWNADGIVVKLDEYFMPDYGAKPRHLVKAFGKPSKIRSNRYRNPCNYYWRGRGIRALFTSFGGGRRSCKRLFLQSVAVHDTSESHWQTAAGLGVGSSIADLFVLYPAAYHSEYSDGIIIADHYFGYGDGASGTVEVAPSADGLTVAGFRLYIGHAGD